MEIDVTDFSKWNDEQLCEAVASWQNGQPHPKVPASRAQQAYDEYERRAGLAQAKVKPADLMKNIQESRSSCGSH